MVKLRIIALLLVLAFGVIGGAWVFTHRQQIANATQRSHGNQCLSMSSCGIFASAPKRSLMPSLAAEQPLVAVRSAPATVRTGGRTYSVSEPLQKSLTVRSVALPKSLALKAPCHQYSCHVSTAQQAAMRAGKAALEHAADIQNNILSRHLMATQHTRDSLQ